MALGLGLRGFPFKGPLYRNPKPKSVHGQRTRQFHHELFSLGAAPGSYSGQSARLVDKPRCSLAALSWRATSLLVFGQASGFRLRL